MKAYLVPSPLLHAFAKCEGTIVMEGSIVATVPCRAIGPIGVAGPGTHLSNAIQEGVLLTVHTGLDQFKVIAGS